MLFKNNKKVDDCDSCVFFCKKFLLLAFFYHHQTAQSLSSRILQQLVTLSVKSNYRQHVRIHNSRFVENRRRW